MEIVQIKDVSYWYPDDLKPALDHVSLDINEGELILVVGSSGCGKSTLIRLVNGVVPNFYGGKIKGDVYFKGASIRDLDSRDIIKNVGTVYQHPEKQIVFQDIEREIAFGLENINMNVNAMKRNVSEVMSFLNLTEIRGRTTQEISGGQRQKVAIASVIAMDPEILIFDEPTSQLDPIASDEVLNSIKKLNRDFGKTVILIEHRLDRCFDMADRVLFMENGKIIGQARNGEIPNYIDKKYFLPTIPYVFKQSGVSSLPINVKQARQTIRDMEFKEPKYIECRDNEVTLEVKNLNFEYEKGAKTLKDINFSVKKGEVIAVMGENGAGKSTLFKVIAGLIDNYKGQICINSIAIEKIGLKERIKHIGYLSQNPNDYLGRNTVFEEVAYTLKNIEQFEKIRVENTLHDIGLTDISHKNPRDLSGGEKQRVAIASTLVTNPDIVVFDEPTRGMDSESKDKLGVIISKLKNQGKSVIIITHDSDFAADFSDKVMLMFNGELITFGYVWDVLFDSIYYSPQIAKVFKNKCKVVRTLDAINLLRME